MINNGFFGLKHKKIKKAEKYVKKCGEGIGVKGVR